ncbi:MAG: transglutaminase-like domain-containing protein [Planctomycetota bacterium]|nr:transglutaminase-like domain-containing protein [Planctomycetota bacterium]
MRRTPGLLVAGLLALAAPGAWAQESRSPPAPTSPAPASPALPAVLDPTPQEETQSDRWYSLEMMGAKAGWMRTSRSRTDGRLTSRSVLRVEASRGAQGAVTMHMESEFVETPEGAPVAMRRVQRLGATDVVQSYVFREQDVEMTSTQSGQTTTTTLPRPEGAWLTPAAAEQFVRQRFKSGAKEISVRTISPEYGMTPVTITRRLDGRERIAAMGRDLDAVRWRVENTIAPQLASTEWTDEEGELVRSVTPLGPLTLTMTASTRDAALARSGTPAPEAMVSTFVKGSRQIANPRRVRRASYVLSLADGRIDDLPSAGMQQVTRLDERRVRVDVEVGRSTAATPAELTPRARATYLASTTLCRADDEVIKELAARGVQGAGESAADRAEALRRLVNRHIKRKTLDVGFATASEVARRREGDCSEHGVLLAALLRAEGIPSRVVAGLIYADEFAGATDIFGYHMWTQALVEINGEPRWIDLDATFPAGIPADATHIALDLSALTDEDPTAGLMSVASVMGRLSIEVEKTE